MNPYEPWIAVYSESTGNYQDDKREVRYQYEICRRSVKHRSVITLHVSIEHRLIS